MGGITAEKFRELLAPSRTLDELITAHPREWEQASAALQGVLEQGTAEGFAQHMKKVRAEADAWELRAAKDPANPRVLEGALPHLLGARMGFLALEQFHLAAATGQTRGTVRFGLLEGSVVQRLFFSSGLTRKPVSMTAFRMCWPLVRQKRILMPLVQKKGIYCFYSREFVTALARLIGSRPCLEIAAGDGTLTRFLRGAGVDIAATDNQSWARAVAYPATVENLDARTALETRAPKVVVCSWAPPGNAFERHVFETRSVDLYVAIGSQHKHAAGNWHAYAEQQAFDWSADRALSGLLLPPELDNAVLVFRRKGAGP